MSERIKPELVIDTDSSSSGDTVPIRWRRRRRRRWYYNLTTALRGWLLPVFIGAASLVVMAALVTVVLLLDAIGDVDKAQARMDQRLFNISQVPATDLSVKDFSDLAATVNEVNAALIRLNQRIRPFRVLVPLASDRTAVQLDIVQARIHLTTGAAHFLGGLDPVVGLLQRSTGTSTTPTPVTKGRRMVELLEDSQIRFVRADEQLQTALDIFDGLDPNSLSPETLLEIREYRAFAAQLQTYNRLALASPALLSVALGVDEPHTYLILVQNNDDLRPSGGNINAWGWLRVRSGRIQDQAYFPATSRSPNPPPTSAVPPFTIPAWWASGDPAWGGSMSGDFSTTAELAAWYYNQGRNPAQPINGVIAIDLTALEYMMNALSDVYIPDYAAIVAARQFREEIYAVRTEQETDLELRRFIAALFTSMVTKWQHADSQTQSVLNRALLRALSEGHIKLYFTDESLQAAVEGLYWAGHQPVVPVCDYLMVAESNLGANKSSSSLYRQITYEVKIDSDATLHSALSIFYDFPASLALEDPAFVPDHYGRDKDYEALVQVYTPAGSLFEEGSSDANLVQGDDPAHTVVMSTVDVMYDDSALMRVAYTSAATIESAGPYRIYRLLVQKQPGMRSSQIKVTVQLPPGSQLIAVSPGPNTQYSLDRPVLEFNLLLRQDEWIEIIYNE